MLKSVFVELVHGHLVQLLTSCKPQQLSFVGIHLQPVAAHAGINAVNSFSTRRLSSCTDEYAHTYGISTYSVQQ